MYYTIEETRSALKGGEITSEKLVRNSIETFEKDKSAAIPLNAFIELYDDAVSKAQEADKEIAAARAAEDRHGLPRLDGEGNVVQHVVRRVVAEADMVERDIPDKVDIPLCRAGLCLGGDVQDFIQTVQRNGRLAEIG